MSGVVVGVNDTQTALLAAQRAAAIAAVLDEPLHLVMASRSGWSGTIRQGNEEFFEDWIEDARQMLRRIAIHIGARNAELTVGDKDPAKAICDVAERTEATLIVVGNRRVQGASRVLGAVATDVLRHAPCDVLVAQTTGAAT